MISELGPPEVLVPAELPDPAVEPGQALVDVAVASVTFVETQVRAGRPPHPAMAPRLPAVLGNGVGGVVASVGDGADPALAGARVVTTTGGTGGYAARAAVPAAGLIEVPEGLDLADAVALLADGRTAIGLLRAAAVAQGETVLVAPAGGGVGTLLVQLAHGAGARVLAAARGERKLTLARELGADATVDYGEPEWTGRAGPIDVAFDGVGGPVGRAAFELVRPGGRFLPFGMASGAFTPLRPEDDARGVTVVRGARPSPEEMMELTRAALTEAAAGRLRPVIGQTFPLAGAADAHAAMEERRTIGKTLLMVESRGSRRG
jgi:NADPH2:quinone reductase